MYDFAATVCSPHLKQIPSTVNHTSVFLAEASLGPWMPKIDKPTDTNLKIDKPTDPFLKIDKGHEGLSDKGQIDFLISTSDTERGQ